MTRLTELNIYLIKIKAESGVETKWWRIFWAQTYRLAEQTFELDASAVELLSLFLLSTTKLWLVVALAIFHIRERMQ